MINMSDLNLLSFFINKTKHKIHNLETDIKIN